MKKPIPNRLLCPSIDASAKQTIAAVTVAESVTSMTEAPESTKNNPDEDRMMQAISAFRTPRNRAARTNVIATINNPDRKDGNLADHSDTPKMRNEIAVSQK